MGIYIKGVELPARCDACFAYERCLIQKYRWGIDRPDNCPLVPIPPHGRLIDADAAVANRNADMNWVYDLWDLPDYLANCPTIIPAEEGER